MSPISRNQLEKKSVNISSDTFPLLVVGSIGLDHLLPGDKWKDFRCMTDGAIAAIDGETHRFNILLLATYDSHELRDIYGFQPEDVSIFARLAGKLSLKFNGLIDKTIDHWTLEDETELKRNLVFVAARVKEAKKKTDGDIIDWGTEIWKWAHKGDEAALAAVREVMIGIATRRRREQKELPETDITPAPVVKKKEKAPAKAPSVQPVITQAATVLTIPNANPATPDPETTAIPSPDLPTNHPAGGPPVITEVYLPVGQIRRFAKQPRQFFDEDYIRSLGKSIKERGQYDAVKVRLLTAEERRQDPLHEYELVDGEDRWRACLNENAPFLRAIVFEKLSPKEQYLMSIGSNFHRRGHHHLEICDAVVELLGMNESWENIATLMGLTIPRLQSYERLRYLHPNIRKRMEPGTPESLLVTFPSATWIVRLDREAQDLIEPEITKSGREQTAQVKALVMKALEKDGVNARTNQTAFRQVKPSDLYRNLTKSLGQVRERLTQWADQDAKAFLAILDSRSPDDRKSLKKSIDELIKLAKVLKSRSDEICRADRKSLEAHIVSIAS